jgi:tetratricopeptide (TPR) repeat protein
MANYMLAFNYLSFDEKNFNVYANKAVNCKAKLSVEELMLRDAMRRFIANKKADNTDIGLKLVKMFPNDISSYESLMFFQYVTNDQRGMIKNLEHAVTLPDAYPNFHNMLGYAYMATGQNDKAMKAFDKYIELAPSNANSYDSKGDYFMNMKDYANAYKSYMKAHEIDTLWSIKKALRAKALADSLSHVK